MTDRSGHCWPRNRRLNGISGTDTVHANRAFLRRGGTRFVTFLPVVFHDAEELSRTSCEIAMIQDANFYRTNAEKHVPRSSFRSAQKNDDDDDE